MAHWQATREQVAGRRQLSRELSSRVGHHVRVTPKNYRRAALWLRDPRCARCGCETVWFCPNGGAVPDNAATLGHRFPRGDPRRGSTAYANFLSCYGCNQADDRLFKAGLDEVVPA